jgi:hypothetical protein
MPQCPTNTHPGRGFQVHASSTYSTFIGFHAIDFPSRYDILDLKHRQERRIAKIALHVVRLDGTSGQTTEIGEFGNRSLRPIPKAKNRLGVDFKLS